MLSFPPPLVHKYLVVLQVILGSLVVITASATTDVGSFPRNVHWNDENLEEMEMVERKGNQFVVGGQPFYVNGFNTYWLMILGADSSTRGKVTETFAAAAAVGLTVGRTWAFNDGGWRALQISPSVYDEVVFKALDFVVSEAKNHNVRLILSLANNWEAYGGKAQYIKWGKVVGLNLTSDDDFFIDPTMKGYYKAHVKTILNRVNTYTNITYKDDPIIFAWELMNEPRCITDPTGNKLQSWIEEMTFYVKSIDPKHLVCVGLEGFYGSSTPDRLLLNPNIFASQVGTDFIRNHQTLGIDFATAHIYPDTWLTNAISNEYLHFIELWIQSHIDDAENVLGMPVIFAEFGVSSKDINFTNEFRDRFIDTVYKKIMNSTRRGGGGGGCLLWQLFPEGVDYMDDGYAIVLPKAESTSTIISLQSKRMQIFNTKCSWKCHWGCKKRNSQVVKSHHNMEL